MSDNLRYLHKWLNEEQDAPIDRVALAEALAEIDHYRSVMDSAVPTIDYRAITQQELDLLETDPALHFCHRFAVVLECILASNEPNAYWTEGADLLSQYHAAIDQWRETAGEPYVSGFGKD